MKNIYKPQSPWIFIGWTYGLSWLLWLPALLVSWGLALGVKDQIFLKVGNFIPSLVATMILMKTMPKKEFFLGLFKIKNNFKKIIFYYMIALVTMPIILVTSYLIIQGFVDLSMASILWPYISKNPLQILPMILYFMIFQGPLGEEIGWRAYLLPQLLKKYKFMNASIIVGSLWACWHLPKFMMPGSTQYLLTDAYGFVVGFIAYLFYTVILSIMISHLYIKSGGSLFVALIFHAMANFSHGLIPLFLQGPASLTFIGMMLAWTLWMSREKITASHEGKILL